MEKKITIIDIDKKVNRDLNYIKNDLICKQYKPRIDIDENGNREKVDLYCKFCRPLNAVSVINMPKSQYIKYWTTAYNSYPEKLLIILKAIDKKFKEELISAEKMIYYILKSNDYILEKKQAIKLLEENTSLKIKKEFYDITLEQYNLERKLINIYFINTFEDIKKISKEYNTTPERIISCYSKEKQTAGGYIWKIKELI